ncbi:hypothetical protein F2Q68_00015794 [Brassica cretica]|uniref:Uncharacterized protein n=2 Tax=Brassica cretica TaxID=69181 RepID=A0A8S9H9Y3_BRACR|nr:hypothetical protein F2Q68_00015794 [Brassica cretica]KAF3612176.1 hypothetical protein DY000_02048362 [Brassica cretica]
MKPWVLGDGGMASYIVRKLKKRLCSCTLWRTMVILEPFESFELAFQFHQFEVNPMVRSEVMPVLLKSGQSSSREEAAIDSVNQVSNHTIHPVLDNTVHPDTVHLDIVHHTSINTVHHSSINTGHSPSFDTVYHGTVHPMTNTTCWETKKIKVLILKLDENGMLRDEEGRTRNSA